MKADLPALTRLIQAVERAASEQRRPPTSGEVERVLPLAGYFSSDERQAQWRVVSEVRARERDLYNRFGSDSFLADTIVQVLADSEGNLDWAGLVKALNDLLDSNSEWLIAVPLANAKVEGYHRMTERIGLAETLHERDWGRDTESPVDRGEIFEHLRDHIDLGARWHPPDAHAGPLDTRRTAALVIVERGSAPLALSVARTRARYALAMWCLLSRPDRRQLWPALADWEPRPHIERPLKYRLYEPEQWAGARSRVKGGGINHRPEYEIPSRPEFLRAPFEAIARAEENRLSARAALSAAWSLYIAESTPVDLERTDRLLHISAAIEALCDLGQGPTTKGPERWEIVTARHGIWDEMKDAYLPSEIRQAKTLVRDLRNIAAHGSDDVLLNLGYPAGQRRRLRGKTRAGHELALAQAAAAYPILAMAAQLVARRIALEGIESGWSDDRFRENFAAAT
jgi:hypothetical protein